MFSKGAKGVLITRRIICGGCSLYEVGLYNIDPGNKNKNENVPNEIVFA